MMSSTSSVTLECVVPFCSLPWLPFFPFSRSLLLLFARRFLTLSLLFAPFQGAILPVFDAIYNSEHFDFVLPRHEQGAGHMAEGYARVSGKPGVVLVTSGPGATNVITPMQDAMSDGVPMVVFCGQGEFGRAVSFSRVRR